MIVIDFYGNRRIIEYFKKNLTLKCSYYWKIFFIIQFVTGLFSDCPHVFYLNIQIEIELAYLTH